MEVKEQGFRNEEVHTNYFVARVSETEDNIKNTWKQQTIMAVVFGLIMAVLVYVIIDKIF